MYRLNKELEYFYSAYFSLPFLKNISNLGSFYWTKFSAKPWLFELRRQFVRFFSFKQLGFQELRWPSVLPIQCKYWTNFCQGSCRLALFDNFFWTPIFSPDNSLVKNYLFLQELSRQCFVYIQTSYSRLENNRRTWHCFS